MYNIFLKDDWFDYRLSTSREHAVSLIRVWSGLALTREQAAAVFERALTFGTALVIDNMPMTQALRVDVW